METQRVHIEAQHPTGGRERLRVASLNISGRKSGSVHKWHHVQQLMREWWVGIMAFQETHLTVDLAAEFNELFGCSQMLVHSPDPENTNARGVTFVIN